MIGKKGNVIQINEKLKYILSLVYLVHVFDISYRNMIIERVYQAHSTIKGGQLDI